MKRTLAAILLVLVLGAIGLLGYQIYRDATARHATAERIATLPAFEVRTLRGETFRRSDLADGTPVVLVYFRTTCPFCQAETRSLRQHEALHAAAPVLMISAEQPAALKQFAATYGLDSLARVRVLRDPGGKVAKAFDIESVPHTFIYGAKHRLLEHFHGEASAEAIYRVLEGKALAEKQGAATAQGGCTIKTQANADCYEN